MRASRSGARTLITCSADCREEQSLKESSTVMDLGGPLSCTGVGSCRRRGGRVSASLVGLMQCAKHNDEGYEVPDLGLKLGLLIEEEEL